LPQCLITVFPGEDHGLHSDSTTLELLKNTFRNQQNEGGNDLVFKNLQAARIGMLDLEKFKRQSIIVLCLMVLHLTVLYRFMDVIMIPQLWLYGQNGYMV